LVALLFQVQGFLRYYFPLHIAITIGVLLFVEKSCTTPLHSFLQELGVVKSRESKTCHSYDILGARMLWKPKEARILKNF
jgi:hypothetical protein